MKTYLILILLFSLAGNAYAQKTQTLVTRTTSPEQDNKPNSDAVPDVMTQSTQFERIVLVRFKFKTDLLEGLHKAVAEQGIQNGVILSAFGSVRGYHVHGVSNRDFPSQNFFMRDPTHPADIISMSGMVMDGRIHPHITLADDERAFGGHLEPGTEVFTFANITIGVLPDNLELSRYDDKTLR
ncbi:MAG: DNA-binding protein [Verrucomicrobia bacterium]|nr:DNA-binding protein [Verrucomicrobiota bacterium]